MRALCRSTGVMGTARWKGITRKAGEIRRSRVGPDVLFQQSGRGGSRRGSYYRRSRVTPGEGRTLTSGMLVEGVEEEVIGDEPDNAR